MKKTTEQGFMFSQPRESYWDLFTTVQFQDKEFTDVVNICFAGV